MSASLGILDHCTNQDSVVIFIKKIILLVFHSYFQSYAPVYFSWKCEHPCPVDTIFHFFFLLIDTSVIYVYLLYKKFVCFRAYHATSDLLNAPSQSKSKSATTTPTHSPPRLVLYIYIHFIYYKLTS